MKKLIFLILFPLVACNSEQINFKLGDSVFYKKGKDGLVNIYRLYRAPNKQDIEKMKIEDWEKRKRIDEIDSTRNYEILQFGEVTKDLAYKNNSAIVGTYIDRTFNLKYGPHLKRSGTLIQINPIKNMIKSGIYTPPNGYIPEDKYFIEEDIADSVDYIKK